MLAPVELSPAIQVWLWTLGTAIPTARGARLSHRDVPPAGPAARARWTTTDRLSVWMRGRFALTDPFGDLRPHRLACLHGTAQHLRDALAPPTDLPRAA